MAEFIMPNVVGSFLSGRQARQAEEQQAIQNQFLRRDQEMQEARFKAEQEELGRNQQFNQLVGQYLGQDTVDALGVPQGSGGAQGSNIMPGDQPAAPQPRVSMQQLYALDPARAMQLQQFQAQQAEAARQQEVKKATEIVTRAQYALRSEAPAKLLKVGFPDLAKALNDQGIDVDALTDDDVRGYAETLIAQFGPVAGIGPASEEDDFTLSEGQTRFDSRGRPIASVAKQASPDDARNNRNDAFNRANTLRDEFTNLTKDFGTVQASFDTIKSVSAKPSAAGDISLLTSFMRMIDPGSTVREGEFATAQNAGGVPQRVIARYNSLLNGERLDASQRTDFVQQAENMLKGRRQQYDKTRSKYRTLAKRAAVDPVDVVGEDEPSAPGAPRSFASEAEAEAAGLAPGTRVTIGGVSGTWQ